MSLRNIFVNKFRSSLAIIGIIIGIASVISLISVSEGSKKRIKEEIERWGPDVFWISAEDTNEYNFVSQKKAHLGFEEKDLNILNKIPHIREVAPFTSTILPCKYLNKKLYFEIIGTTHSYYSVLRLSLIKGRFLTPFDIESKYKVCVIEDNKITRELFGYELPIGKEILINNKNFKIVGMIQEKKEIGSVTPGRVYIPLSLFKKVVGFERINLLYAKASSPNSLKKAKEEAKYMLELKYNKKGIKIFCYSITELLVVYRRLVRMATLVIGIIASISLITGGIGITNVMLLSVKERTKEIGIRKAIGARNIEILIQFLIEAICLTLVGATFGLLLGVCISKILTPLLNIECVISVWGVLVTIAFSFIIGLLSGTYPAKSAASLNPVNALRYE